MKTDVVIVGNGIAGSVLSLLLKQKQISHAVLSRTVGRRDFALAETLPPTALPLLRRLQLLELFEQSAIQKTFGYHSLWGSNRIIDHNFFGYSPFKYGLKLDKQALLRRMTEQVESHLVPCLEQPGIRVEPSGITIEIGRAKTISAKLIVDATGRNRAVLNLMKIPVAEHDSLVSFSCHAPRIKHPRLTHGVYVESFEHGWGMASTLNDRENVITLFTHRGNRIQKEMKKYRNWPSLLSDTIYLKDFLTLADRRVVGGNANSSLAEQSAGRNWLAVGDAAMAFDPLSSHGITNALYTASQAAAAIETNLTAGGEAPLRAYSDSLASIGAAYLKAKHDLYSQERRWPGATFWLAAQKDGPARGASY